MQAYNPAPLDVNLALSAANILENDVVTLSGSFTDLDPVDTHRIVINWGDTAAQTVLDLPTGMQNFSVHHRYLDNPVGLPSSRYSVTVTVTDKDGSTAEANASVTVANVAPAAQITGLPTTVAAGTALTLGSSVSDPGTADVAAGSAYTSLDRDDGRLGLPDWIRVEPHLHSFGRQLRHRAHRPRQGQRQHLGGSDLHRGGILQCNGPGGCGHRRRTLQRHGRVVHDGQRAEHLGPVRCPDHLG